MAGEHLQFLRVFRLKDAIQQATRDKVFVDYKRFGWVTRIVNCEEFWDTLFAIIQALYPAYRMLRLSDMKFGGQDKMKYYVCQADCLMEPGFQNALEKWENVCMPREQMLCHNLTEADMKFLDGKERHGVIMLVPIYFPNIYCDCSILIFQCRRRKRRKSPLVS